MDTSVFVLNDKEKDGGRTENETHPWYSRVSSNRHMLYITGY